MSVGDGINARPQNDRQGKLTVWINLTDWKMTDKIVTEFRNLEYDGSGK